MENFGLYSTLARLREEQQLTNAERTAARREDLEGHYSRLDDLRVWKLFAQSSIGDSSFLEARRPVKLRSMGEVIQLSFHTTCAWITSLYITCPRVSPTDLVTVSELDNLRSFHMATSQHTPTHQGLNDRVLRGWANAALFEGALQNLRFIFLYSQREVTKWSLNHLDAFPSLEEFCAYNCGIHWRSVEHKEGWLKRPADSFSAFVNSSAAHQQQPWHGTFYSGLYSWDTLVAEYVTNRLGSSTENIDERPLLKATVNRHSVDHKLDRPADMVCLKRRSDPLPSKEEAPLDVENMDLRPVVKKRKIVFDSDDLGGMLGV